MSYVNLEQLPTCQCLRCKDGMLVAGHCVDIDGDFWHNCPAVQASLEDQ